MWKVHYTHFNKHVPGLLSTPRHDCRAQILAVPHNVGGLCSRRKLQLSGDGVSLRWAQVPLERRFQTLKTPLKANQDLGQLTTMG